MYPLNYNNDLKTEYLTQYNNIVRWAEEINAAKAVQVSDYYLVNLVAYYVICLLLTSWYLRLCPHCKMDITTHDYLYCYTEKKIRVLLVISYLSGR